MESFSHTSRLGLWDWIRFSRERASRDSRLPFRLCIVEDSPGGWCVTGFISERLEYRVFRWASAAVAFEKVRIGNVLDNGLFKGAQRIFFERCVFDHLGRGHPLTVATRGGDVIFNFKPLFLTDRRNAVVIPGRLHQIDHESFGSIEGYAIVNKTLLLLQTTVSETHSGARYKDVQHIVKLARDAVGTKRISILVVYITPSDVTFKAPSCFGFPNHKVFWGKVDDSKFWARPETGADGLT
jgi:hypothetical protein